jgi:ketosteroid isomerase-like protein
MRIAATILLLVALAGCEKAPSGKSPVTEAEALKIAETTETNYSKDAKTIAGLYGPKTVVFDPAHVEPTDDPKVMSDWAQEFVSMKPADYIVSNRHIQVLGPDAFVSSGIARFTVQAGQARPQVGVRFSQVYGRGKDGGWKIVHEHMSMPPTPAGQPQQ